MSNVYRFDGKTITTHRLHVTPGCPIKEYGALSDEGILYTVSKNKQAWIRTDDEGKEIIEIPDLFGELTLQQAGSLIKKAKMQQIQETEELIHNLKTHLQNLTEKTS